MVRNRNSVLNFTYKREKAKVKSPPQACFSLNVTIFVTTSKKPDGTICHQNPTTIQRESSTSVFFECTRWTRTHQHASEKSHQLENRHIFFIIFEK